MISLSGLNPEQLQAATVVEGPVLILAGAGSGKTRTLTYRIGHLLDHQKIPAEQILAVTFTNKASREMKERVRELLGPRKMRGLTVCTFHALGVRILREEIHHLGYHNNFNIFDTADQLSVIREALRHYRSGKDKFDKKALLAQLSQLKNQGIDPAEYAQSQAFDANDENHQALEFVYRYYQEKLHIYNVIDFDDILSLTLKLFQTVPGLKEKYSQQYRYQLIDEYQDTNTLQFELIKGLTSTHHNICVVGDDDQSIYAFRGADISNILNFEKVFPGAQVIKLEQNYRSRTPILDLANEIIKQNRQRKIKKMWSAKHGEQKPFLWLVGDSDHEAAVIGDDLNKLRVQQIPLKEVALLFRSNTQIPPFEEEMRLQDIPYRVVGGQKFFEKKEIKDLIAYLAWIHNPRNEMALRRIINVPTRGIGHTTFKKILAAANERGRGLLEALEQHQHTLGKVHSGIDSFLAGLPRWQQFFRERPLPQALEALVAELDFIPWIEQQYPEGKQAQRKRRELQQFIQGAHRYLKYNPYGQLKDYLERILLQDSQDNNEEEAKNEVTLMTLHSSKGLEFDYVYLIGMEEEILPHKKTIQQGDSIEEERRLAYVGVTRARERLVMTAAKERELYGRRLPRFPSRFIQGLEHTFIQQDRTRFDHMSAEETSAYKKNFFQNLAGQLD